MQLETTYDDDTTHVLKKQRLDEENSFNTHSNNVDVFYESLNMKPRKVQEQLLKHIHTQVENKSKFVIDLPTGGGKSALAGFAGTIAIKYYDYKRILYITSSKTLQKQVTLDAAKWNIFENNKSVVCQFGKSNYFCPKRLENLIARKPDDANSILQLSNGSVKISRKITDILLEMAKINIKSINILDDFYITSYREAFNDKMKKEEVPEINIFRIWDEISASGGCEKQKTKCTCRKDLFGKFNKDQEKDLNSFLIKNLNCPCCKIRVLAKTCGILVTNMDALFSYMQHAALTYIVNPSDFIIFDEAHNITKRAQELFEGKTQRNFSCSKIEESLKKWSKNDVNLVKGNIDHKIFYNFPDEDRAILSFDNKRYTEYYGLVYQELSKMVLNPRFNKEIRSKVVDDVKDILDKYNEEEQEFEDVNSLLCLKNRIGHISNILGLDLEITDEIIKETCKERQTVLGEPDKDDCTNNKNKALSHLQAEIANKENSKNRSSMEEEDFMKECFKIYKNGDETIEHLYNTVNEIHKCMTDLEVSQQALDKQLWTNNIELYKKFIPKICKNGLIYEMTFMEKAKILEKHLWNEIEAGVMLMSATLSNPEKDEEYSFEDFFSEVGLPLNTSCHATKEVFDSKRMTIYVPPMQKYSFNLSIEEKKKYDRERIELMTNAVKLNPLATLVLSNNVEDYKSVIYYMKKNLKSHKHIDYNKDVGLFKEFESGNKNNVVIYGAEKLWTGLNLPGRIGMVVILKPFNKFRMIEEPYYTSIFKNYYKETGINCIETFNSLYRYNTCRDTIQAAGRVMRKEDDSGIIMFLSDNKKDANMLKNKYKSANTIYGKKITEWIKSTEQVTSTEWFQKYRFN